MIKFAKAIGANTDFLTAQAFVFPKNISTNAAPEELTLGVIISASGEDVFSKVRASAPIIEETFTRSEKTAGERLSEISLSIKEQLKEVENLQYLLAVWREGTVYLESKGFSKAFLLRDGNLLDLSAQSANQMVSGHLKENDRLLLISSRQIDSSDQNEMKINDWDDQFIKKLALTELDALEEELEGYLHQSQKMDPLAVILIESTINEQNTQNDEIPAIPDESIGQKSRKITQLAFTLLTKLKDLIPESKKGKLIVAAAGIIIILALIGLFNFQKAKLKTHEEFLNFYNQAQQKFQVAQSLKDSDPNQAQINLTGAKNDLETALNFDPKSNQGQKLKKEIEEGSGSILKIYNITDWPPFLSLDLIKSGFNSQKLSFSLGKITLLDDKEKTLVVLDLKDKKPQILSGALQLGSASFASINGSKVYAFSPDKGITLINLEDGGSPKPSVIVKPDPEWGIITDIVGFSGNVYLLDSTKNQIYKYIPVKSDYSDKISYLRPDQKSEFAGAKKMDIDYSVWVLKSGPEILKFTGGYADGFSVSGMDKNLLDLKSMFIAEGDSKDADNGNAYFLDSQNSRLVILNKKGQYISQYTGEKFKSASDFVVDEKEKKIYLLEGNKIYQLDLKN